MKVIATERGYYKGLLREPGSEFDIQPKEFSERWMKRKGGRRNPSSKSKGK